MAHSAVSRDQNQPHSELCPANHPPSLAEGAVRCAFVPHQPKVRGPTCTWPIASSRPSAHSWVSSAGDNIVKHLGFELERAGRLAETHFAAGIWHPNCDLGAERVE